MLSLDAALDRPGQPLPVPDRTVEVVAIHHEPIADSTPLTLAGLVDIPLVHNQAIVNGQIPLRCASISGCA
jgi:hypothetical protein